MKVMRMPRFIVKWFFAKDMKDVQCEECGEILGSFANLERAEWAVERHYITKHPETNEIDRDYHSN